MSKNDSIIALEKLVKSLNKNENLLIRKQLILYSGERKNLSLKLFSVLKKINTEKVSSKYVAKKIYKNDINGLKALRMLSSRLQTKILETLTSDISLGNKQDWDDLEIVNISLRKKLTQFYYLYLTRSHNEITNQLLEEIITTAKKYEAAHILVEALKYKKYRVGYRDGEKAFNDKNKEIEFYLKVEHAKTKANDLFYKMIILQNSTTNEDKVAYSEFLRSAIQELEVDFKETNSASVKYYLQILRRNYFLTINNTLGAINICIDIIKNLQSAPEIYRKERLGSAYLFLSQLETKERKFTKAITSAKNASSYFANNTTSYLHSQDILFKIHFYNRNFPVARNIAKDLVTNQSDFNSSIKNKIHNFYLACVLFKEAEYKKCLKELSTNNLNLEDKTGWDIGIRIVNIQTFIELNALENAERSLDSLRKHIHYNQRRDTMRLRDLEIIAVLNRLANQSFDFKKTYALEAASLERLCSADPEYGFEFFTHELIPFHEWFMEKAGVRS